VLRIFPALALLLLIAPVTAGILGVLLPAFGYLPAVGGTRLSLQPFRELIAMPGLARSALLSLGTGLATTAVALALTMLFVAGWRGSRLFAVLERLISPLLSVPHAAAAVGLAFLIAPSGFLARLVSPWATGWETPPDLLIVQDRLGVAMTIGLTAKEIPFLFLMTLAALPQARAADMARTTAALGYGRVMGFVHGALPAVYRQIRLAVFAVLAFSTSVVDVAIVLGPTTPAPLAVRILEWRNDPDLDRQFMAAAGAVLQIAVTGAALLIWLRIERMCGAVGRALAGHGARARRDLWLRRAAAGAMALFAAIVLAGIALLALSSVAGAWRFPDAFPTSLSAETWMRTLSAIATPLANAAAIAAAASLVAIVLALGALEWRARSGRSGLSGTLQALYLPLVVPQVAFLFGLQIFFARLGVDGTFPAVLLAHLVFVFPYVLLSLDEPWRGFDPRYVQAARALLHGADAVFWGVRLPILARPVLTAAALGFAISVGLYLPTLLIGGGRWPTVTTETVALASGGDRRLVGATALAQALLPFIGFAAAAIVGALLFRRRRMLRASA
jgi:putative thiamine transport system permease protein